MSLDDTIQQTLLSLETTQKVLVQPQSIPVREVRH